MLKILILQRIYNLSDDQTEYHINDRMSFMRFLGFGLEDRVPDSKTSWLFRDTLTKANAAKALFDGFAAHLEAAHLITRTGTMCFTQTTHTVTKLFFCIAGRVGDSSP